MAFKLNIFSRILILVILLLIPILLLYSYSNFITKNVVQDQIQTSNLNQLTFFMHQLDSEMERLSMFPVILGNDPHIREFIDHLDIYPTDRLKAESRITEKLSLQSVSSGWSNELTLIMSREKKVLSSSIYVNGATSWPWASRIRKIWTFDESAAANQTPRFVREISEPAVATQFDQAHTVFQVNFPVQNIKDLLDVYKQDKQSDPFLYHDQWAPIRGNTSLEDAALPIISSLRARSTPMEEAGQEKVRIDKQDYLISYIKSEQLGWYLVDYVPVQKIMSPITTTSNLFYVSTLMLLLMSVIASFLLYRNVQIPILKMIRSIHRMERGDLSARIEYRSKNEFDYLILRFNEMAERIQVLVEDVYVEKIRSREATVKQLQSQINPHFLYNSLFFIINSSMLEDNESVAAMAQNLAEYYRYTTRVEKQTVPLKEELEFVRHYLNIQNLRMHRLEYEISVPEEMLDEQVPRLIIQPLVENAIIHGIEHRRGDGRITIKGEQDASFNRIIVQDNGAGLTDEGLRQLRSQLASAMTDEIGCGTWNVHHRLLFQFGEHSGLTFENVPDGGLKAVLTWNRHSAQASQSSQGGE